MAREAEGWPQQSGRPAVGSLPRHNGGPVAANITTTGSFGLSAGGAGVTTLVTATKIHSTTPLVPAKTSAAPSRLILTYVPEPGGLWLLACGAIALGAARQRS